MGSSRTGAGSADSGVPTDSDDEFRRMRWASRRGMLELDLLLGPFVERHYALLDTPDRQLYRRLMECQDQELFAWFLGKEQPDDEELQRMVALVRDAQRAAV